METNSYLDMYYFLEDLRSKDINLYVEDGKLKYKAKQKNINEEILGKIRKNKEQLLDYFKMEKDNKIQLSPLQLAYMAGQFQKYNLSSVNAHYYIEYEKDNIDINKLEYAINLLIKNNDCLRLVISTNGEGIIFDEVPRYGIKVYFDSSLQNCKDIRRELSSKKYVIGKWPMFTFCVEKFSSGKDILHVSFDCSILDAWSASQMMNKLFDVYRDKEIKFSDYSYKDYMKNIDLYKNSIENKKIIDRANLYWEDKAKSISDSPQLQTTKAIEDLNEITFNRKEYSFTEDDTSELHRLIKHNRVTMSSLMMTIYMKVLSYFSNNKNLTVNVTLFGKLPLDAQVNETLGEFTNIGLIEYVNKDQNFIDEIRQTQIQAFKLIEFRMYDGINILNKISKYKEKSVNFPFVITSMIGDNLEEQNYGFSEIYSISQTPQVILDHHVRIIDKKLKISFDYVGELFSEEYIEKFAAKYVELMNKIKATYDWKSLKL